jgi:hypothetical protein
MSKKNDGKVIKMMHTCPADGCNAIALMFMMTVVMYIDQTTVGVVVLCPTCARKSTIEYGLEAQEGKLLKVDEMTNDEIDLTLGLDGQ